MSRRPRAVPIFEPERATVYVLAVPLADRLEQIRKEIELMKRQERHENL